MRRFPAVECEAFVERSLVATGLPKGGAAAVAALMVRADRRGPDGNGIFRLPQYVRRIRAGGINLHPNIRVVRETPVMALAEGASALTPKLLGKSAPYRGALFSVSARGASAPRGRLRAQNWAHPSLS